MNSRFEWYDLPPGIIDVRLMFSYKDKPSEAWKLRQTYRAINYILGKHDTCEFTVGMASQLGSRHELYGQQETTWKPTHLFLITVASCREAAGVAEAALISELRMSDYTANRNINFRNSDRGGTGTRREETRHSPHYIYLACKA